MRRHERERRETDREEREEKNKLQALHKTLPCFFLWNIKSIILVPPSNQLFSNSFYDLASLLEDNF